MEGEYNETDQYYSQKGCAASCSGCAPLLLVQVGVHERRSDKLCVAMDLHRLPFGIRRMFLWLVPHSFDLAGTVGVVVLNVIVGGIIGGFAFVWQLASGLVAVVKG